MATTDNQLQAVPELSIVQGGPLFNLRKMLGFVPETGRGLVGRTAALVAFVSLPVIVGALIERRLLPGENPDPLFRHFGVHARALIAIPLLIFAEVIMDRIVPAIVGQFASAGLVVGSTRDSFLQILRRTERLRDSLWGHLFVAGSILAAIAMSAISPAAGDEMRWATSGAPPAIQIGFAGWWSLYVGRSVFVFFLALWTWRLFIGWVLIRQISKLDLQLAPSHPDQAGGLGFVQQISLANGWIVLAISTVLAGRWGHDVLYHQVHVESLRMLMAVYVGMVLLVFVGPLFLFSRNLRRFKYRAHREYSALVGRQGQLVHRKWIYGEEIGNPEILDSPELSCVADTNTVFEAVGKMRLVPVGQEALIPLVLAVAVPMLPVFAIEIPLKDLLAKIGSSLL